MANNEPLHGVEISYLRATKDMRAHWLIEAYNEGTLLEDRASTNSGDALAHAAQLAAKYKLPINEQPRKENMQ